MAQRLLSYSWENSPTGNIFQQLTMTRVRFYRHPLYRRWSDHAYDGRLAYVAEIAPDWLANIVPMLFMVGPFVALLVAIFFGRDVFNIFLIVTSVILILLMMILASLGMILAAGLVTFSVIFEREAGRWDLLMLLPYDRVSLLSMRIASMLHPYRPLVVSLEVLQTVMAVLTALIVNASTDSLNSDVVGACFVFFFPSLLVLTWERRQDYAFSVALGTFAGLARKQQHGLGISLGGALMMLGIRALVSMLAFGLSPRVHTLGVVLPGFVGGPAMLPLVGVSLRVSLPLLLAYYGVREMAIIALWQGSMRRMRDWG